MHTIQELRNLTEGELHSELKKARIDLHKVRLGVATKQEKAHHKLPAAKKYIARVLTALKSHLAEKQLTQ